MSSSAIREWARENGYQVGTRGRFSKELLAAYEKAHAKPEPKRPRRKQPEPAPVPEPEAPKPRARRRKRDPLIPDNWPTVEGPIENDWTITKTWKYNGREIHPGTELSIRGERGRFRFIKHVIRPNGIEWIDVWGGPKKSECWRSFRPERIRTVHRINRTGENLLAARKAAA